MAAPPLVYSRFKAPEATAGTLDVYEAGSLSNRKTTYSNPGLTTANANPVVLNSLGEADVFYTGLAQLVLKNSSGSTIWTKDNIGLSGDTTSQFNAALTATYASSTTFTLSGDQTTEYHVNRRIKLTGSSTAYGRITATSYSNPNTTVTVVLTSGTLDATLASTATSIIAGDSTSGVNFSHVQATDVPSVAGTTVLDTVIGDYCVITGTNPITAFTMTKGQHMYCRAGGAFSMANSASLILPGGVNIIAASGDTFMLVGEASGVVRCLFYERAVSDGLTNFISGFVPTLGADTDHDLSFATGFCRNAADTANCKPTWSTLVKQIDAAFAEGTNQGGMATGAVANSTAYYYNLIRKNADTSVFDICIDVSSSNANTPSGWTFMREIHREFTDASANLRSQSYRETAGGGIRSRLLTGTRDFLTNNPGTNLVTQAIAAPPGTEINCLITLADATPAATTTHMLVAEVGSAATEPAAAGPDSIFLDGVDLTEEVIMSLFIDSSRNLEYELSNSTADHNVSLHLLGWTNHRRT